MAGATEICWLWQDYKYKPRDIYLQHARSMILAVLLREIPLDRFVIPRLSWFLAATSGPPKGLVGLRA